MKCLSIAIALILICLSSFAQELIIRGTVLDDHGQALVGVNIFLQSDWKTGTSTDIEGRFSLQLKNSNESDSIIISYIGYRDQVRSLKDKKPMEIVLTPISRQMAEVVISAERLIAEEFSIKKIKKLEVYLNPSAKADPILAVNSMPSATTTDESANISFRGSSPSLTGIYLNNVPIYDAVRFSQLNGIGTFSLFNTNVIDNVQVFAGNPPIEYGNTASGLISLTSTSKVPKSTTKSIAISPASFGGTIDLPISDKVAISAFTNYQPSAILKAINTESLKDILSFRSMDGGLHYLQQLKRGQFKVFNYTLNEQYEYNFKHPSYRGEFLQSKTRNLTIGSWRRTINENNELSVNGGFSYSDASFSYSSALFSLENKNIFGSVNHLTYLGKVSVKYGVSYDRRSLDGNYITHQYGYALAEHHPTSQYDDKSAITLLDGYAYTKQEISEHIIIGLGIRKNIANNTIPSYWSAQANGLIKIKDNQQLNLSIGQYHKYDFPRNNDPYTEHKTRQASIEYTLNHNLMSYQVATYHIYDTNIDENTTGLELYTEGFVTPKLKIQASISYLQKDKTNFPRYFSRAMFTYKLPKLWSISGTLMRREGTSYQNVISASYRSNLQVYQPLFSESQSQRYNDYSSVDMSISKLIPTGENTTIVVFATLSNIFNRKNQRAVLYNENYSDFEITPFSLRTFYAGVVINW